MKIKLDENLPNELFDLLVSRQHDVHTVPSEQLAGKDDQTIFDAAMAEERLLLTQDLDFSDVRKFKPGTHAGIVLIRLRHPSRSRLIERFEQVLRDESIESWAGCFVVVTDRKLRVRRP
jgi:predicted nuclease of predicted toxin-antitoxin system